MHFCDDKNEISNYKSIYLRSLQIGERVELFTVFKNNTICITKRSKIGIGGFVCPRFLREMSILRELMNPPHKLVDHPGRKNIVQLLRIYEEENYLHFDMEYADGTLCDLQKIFDLNIIREQILIDISNALQYIHEMGFNHNDLSLSNIAYIKCDDSKTKMIFTQNMFKFILIDFGNSFHKSRPLTLSASTIYTMPLESINALKILQELESNIRTAAYRRKEKLLQTNEQTECLRSTILHKKVDIWSLGALSYYLHNFKFYANGETLEDQRDQIIKREIEYSKDSNHEIIVKCHLDFLSKTNMMLIGDNIIRPVIYFSKPTKFNEDNEKENKDGFDVKNNDLKKPSSLANLQYKVIEGIINDVSAFSGRKFMIESTDKKTLSDVIEHCANIENKIIKKVVNNIRPIICAREKFGVINLICVIRAIIVWLVSHLYINEVWSFRDFVMYVSRRYIHPMKNASNIIKIVALKILEATNWNLERTI